MLSLGIEDSWDWAKWRAEYSNKRGKSIALKSTQRKLSSSKAMKAIKESEEDQDTSSDDNDEEEDEIAHLLWMQRAYTCEIRMSNVEEEFQEKKLLRRRSWWLHWKI